MAKPNTYALLADIGGTNTRVALADGTTILSNTEKKFRNADYPGLETVLSEFLAGAGNPDCSGACVAAAGPVRDGVGQMTNLDWTIDGETIARAARAEKVAVLNDLQAQGYALGHLPDSSLTRVVDGAAAPAGATMLVIGIGTGFNCAPVYATPGGRFVPPAEAGHVNLPIRTELEFELGHALQDVHGFPSVEEVLSGRGSTASSPGARASPANSPPRRFSPPQRRATTRWPRTRCVPSCACSAPSPATSP